MNLEMRKDSQMARHLVMPRRMATETEMTKEILKERPMQTVTG